jgi:hypothetical protein
VQLAHNRSLRRVAKRVEQLVADDHDVVGKMGRTLRGEAAGGGGGGSALAMLPPTWPTMDA